MFFFVTNWQTETRSNQNYSSEPHKSRLFTSFFTFIHHFSEKKRKRKGRDIKWILIENIYSLFWGIFGMKRLYMFSISIHLIYLPFRGFNCEAISLF
jgi:hypothetical protein